MKSIWILSLLVCFVIAGCDSNVITEADGPEGSLSANLATSVSVESATIFQSAGDPMGVGLLDEGSVWGPTNGSHATLKRGKDYLQINVHTTGLPPGAYTNWWVLLNNPAACDGPCTINDVFENPAAEPTAFFATGKIVKMKGVGNFSDRTSVGEAFGDPGSQHLFGDGLTNPAEAVLFYIIKYHGPPSEDPDELHGQLTTLLGSCDAAANALPNGQCFDPQWIIFD